jgi:hypothetical protein
MLPAHDDGAREAPRLAAADSQPAATQQAPQSLSGGTFAVASTRSEQAKDPARMMGPVPVRVTVVTAPSASGAQRSPALASPLAAPAVATAPPPSVAAPTTVTTAPPTAPAAPSAGAAPPAATPVTPTVVTTQPPAPAASAAAAIVAAKPPVAAPTEQHASLLTEPEETGALATDPLEPRAQADGQHSRFSYIHRLAHHGYWHSEARQRRWAARSANEPAWLRDILQRLSGRPHSPQQRS